MWEQGNGGEGGEEVGNNCTSGERWEVYMLTDGHGSVETYLSKATQSLGGSVQAMILVQ